MASQQPETTYYEQGSIKVTSARAVFGNTSYALANITSVAAGTISPSVGLYIGMVIVGVGIIAYGFTVKNSGYVCWGAGAVLAVAGVIMARAQKNTYVVKIGTAGGEQRASMSQDRAEVDKIVAALNDAIVKRG